MIWSPNVETIESGNIAVTNFPATQPVSGTVAVSNFPATQPVSGTVTATGPLTDAELRATPVPVSGNFGSQSVSSATVTNTATSASSVTLAASNAARVKLVIQTDSGTTFVKLGTAASLSSYTYRLSANTTLEITQYTGAVTCIRNSGTGFVLVTEL